MLCRTPALGLEPLCEPCYCGAQYHQKCMTVAFNMHSECGCLNCGMKYGVRFVNGTQIFCSMPPAQVPFISHGGMGFQPAPFASAPMPMMMRTPTKNHTPLMYPPSPNTVWSTSTEQFPSMFLPQQQVTIAPPTIEMADETESSELEQWTNPVSQEWRAQERDQPVRLRVVESIVNIIVAARSGGDGAPRDAIMKHASQAEKYLYFTAGSFEEYVSEKTFMERLKQYFQQARVKVKVKAKIPPQGAWQNRDRDLQIRKQVATAIYQLMQSALAQTSLSTEEVDSRVWSVENVLYTTASSLEEYIDKPTFTSRITQACQMLSSGSTSAPVASPATDSYMDFTAYFHSHPHLAEIKQLFHTNPQVLFAQIQSQNIAMFQAINANPTLFQSIMSE
jgi:hypothetical protein